MKDASEEEEQESEESHGQDDLKNGDGNASGSDSHEPKGTGEGNDDHEEGNEVNRAEIETWKAWRAPGEGSECWRKKPKNHGTKKCNKRAIKQGEGRACWNCGRLMNDECVAKIPEGQDGPYYVTVVCKSEATKSMDESPEDKSE